MVQIKKYSSEKAARTIAANRWVKVAINTAQNDRL